MTFQIKAESQKLASYPRHAAEFPFTTNLPYEKGDERVQTQRSSMLPMWDLGLARK
jgi:hypothetical protein